MIRRELLLRAWRAIGVLALAEAVAAIGFYLWPRRLRPREGGYDGVVTAGPCDLFEPGTVTAFAKGQFYLVRLKEGGFLALSRTCPHLRCTVPWSPTARQFVCPCHASTFDETGDVLSAPATRPLDFYRVSIEGGVVRVDTRVALPRTRFDPSQVVSG